MSHEHELISGIKLLKKDFSFLESFIIDNQLTEETSLFEENNSVNAIFIIEYFYKNAGYIVFYEHEEKIYIEANVLETFQNTGLLLNALYLLKTRNNISTYHPIITNDSFQKRKKLKPRKTQF